MMRHLIVVVLLLTIRTASAAPSPIGLWLTQGHDGIARVFGCGANLCVELAGLILDHPTDPTPVDYRGVSQCHLRLISDARPAGPSLWKGHIIDPRNGSIYGVELRLTPHNDLAVRGFLGVPLLGHTQTWTRYPGSVPDDCRVNAGGSVASASHAPSADHASSRSSGR